VKGSQFPRSYYKCTFQGCPAKKQVETVIENDKPVVRTLYKGTHNHDPPHGHVNRTQETNNNSSGESLDEVCFIVHLTVNADFLSDSTRNPYSNGKHARHG
jgi:hypothetical protein